MFDPYQIKAGESVTLEMEFDWTRKDISKDFSVVVWATEHEVEILHVPKDRDGPQRFSDHFPNLKKALAFHFRLVQVREVI